ncbi:Lactoylglutathione lyase [Cyphellophora attinorum]|uniref:Lactoylglutathione lyase n=1 Tax=Cyphellophora attinorum TaxID=1664694 RepID=A0A0N1HPB4_9EURO|nr:Lactoylglutathione lyase [Phialophora attinorum]KPI39543.1 Lactoylglutathione lyase [Phialophora attinorum]
MSTTDTNDELSVAHHPFRTTYPPGQFTPAGLPPYPPPPNKHTTGFKLNHMMMRIRDPQDSLHFYVTLMGMRSVFTMNTGPYTIYYLGYPSESSRQDGKSMMSHTLGLLELYHVHGSERQPKGYYNSGNDPARGLGFSHLGFTVPDVRSTLKYLRANNVEVIKDVGPGTSTRRTVPISEAEEKLGVGVGDYEGEVVEERGKIVELREEYTKVFDEIAFVSDPDGYTVELVPQGVDPLA